MELQILQKTSEVESQSDGYARKPRRFSFIKQLIQ